MAWVATAVGVVSLGMGAASAAGAFTPSQPNLAASSKEVSDAQLAMLPDYRRMSGAANIGTTALLPGYTSKEVGGQTVYFDKHGKSVPASKAVADFTGYGAGDTQGKLADQSAASNLALAQKYDPAFIQTALEQEALANPEGVAARKLESELIQRQIGDHSVNPVAAGLEGQVSDQLNAGKGLDAFDQQALQQSVADALKSRAGGNGQNADWAQPLTTGFAGDQRQLAGIQKAASELSSGTTTGDTAYRREQQNLANLGNEISGQTPTSEFSSLSAAQNGPAPSVSGTPLPLAGNNSLAMGAQAGATQYANQVNTPNPWMTGVTTAINSIPALTNIANGGNKP